MYILNWTASNGSCTAFSDVVRINAYDPPSTASAGPDQTACQLATQLDAVAPTKGIGIWTLTTDPSSGGIVIDSPNNPKSTLTIANPYLLPVGDYVFTWTVSNGPACAVSTDTVTIKFTGAPPTPANAGPDQKLCGVTTAVMNANPVNPGTGTWTQVSGPSTAIFSNKFEAKSTVSGLETGEYLFKWTSESGGCSLEDTMKITISAAVATVEAGPDQTVEEFNAISMSATNPAPNTGTWTFVSGPNTPAILDINSPTTQIAGTVPGTYVFRFTVSNGTCDNISDTVSITIIGQTDLSLTKTASTLLPKVGDVVSFTVALKNEGNRDANGIAVTDILPIGMSLVPGTVSNSGTFNSGNNSINWTNLTVADQATLNLTYQVRINAPTGVANEYKNTAQVTASSLIDPDSTPNNNVATEDDQSSITLAPTPTVDIAIVKTANAAAPLVGSNITFNLEVKNNGPSNATGVVVTDIIPSGYTYLSSNTTLGTINSSNPATTGLVWNIGNLAKDATVSMSIIATVKATGAYTNAATVVSTSTETDSNTANNTSSVTPTPVAVANLNLTKEISEGPYNVGSNVTFTVKVNNAGPSNATAVSVIDYLPSGYSYVSHNATGGYNPESGAWTIGTIANGAQASLIIVAKINASGDYRNVAEIVHSDQVDTNSTPGNNVLAEDDQAQQTITVVQVADLSLLKKVDNSTPRVGDNVKFTLELSNAGPSDATAVVVNDQLPIGYAFLSYTATSGTYDRISGNWELSGKVLSGKTEYLEIIARVNATTATTNEYRNNAQVTSSGTLDPDSTPNDGEGDDFATVSTNPTALIDLSLTNSVDNVAPVVGTNVVFTVTVNNAGPSTATGIQIRDIIRSGYTFVSATASDGTIDSADPTGTGLLWSIPSQLNGGNAVMTIIARVNPTGDFKNVAQIVTANETDVDSTPNNNLLAEDDQDEVTTSQVALIDLSLVKTVDVSEPNVGDNVTFTVNVKNTGPSAATGVVVTDKLPTGYAFVGFTVSQGNYVATTGSWTIGTMPSSSTEVVTLTVTAKVLADGNYNNIAEVTGANEIDSNSTPANNDSEETDQDEAFVSPKPIADLSVVKSVNISTPVVGTNVVFTIVVANAGPSTATGVIIEDILPNGYEFVSAVPSVGMYNSTSGLWTVSRPIVSGFSESIQITAKVLATGNYLNTASVNASNQIDPVVGNNTSTITTTPTASVDLVVVKRINNTTPNVGSTVNFTVEVTNNGPSTATDVIVTDQLQSGYTYLSDSSAGSYDAITGVWTIGTLASEATATLNISATVNATGDYGNRAVASSLEAESTPTNNSSSISSTPRPVANLKLSKTLLNGPLKVGENATFEIVVTNDGPSDATAVAVLDKLPSGFEFVSATPPGSSTYTSADGAWNIGAVANGATATMQITAKILSTGNYTNVAQITTSNEYDPNSVPGNNNPAEDDQSQVTVSPQPIADLSVAKTANTLTPAVGSNVIFTVVVKNEGPSAATGVVLKDLLASGYQFLSAVPSSGLYTETDGIWTLSRPIAAETSETIQITAKVLATGVYKNDAEVTKSDQLDPDSAPDDGAGDDFATVTPVPTALVDLVIVKRINDAVPNVGATVAFTIVVTNVGPSTATEVVVTDQLQSGYTFLSDTSGGTYNAGTGVWTIGTLASGATATLNISATVNATGDYGNSAVASSLEAESTPANNSTSISSTPRPVASLSLSKAIVNAPLKIGDNAIFELVVTNAGPSDATGVAVLDKLPSGFEFVSATPPGSSTYNSTTGAWDIDAIANGATATMRVTATVLATGNYTNVAEISASNQYDLNSIPGNNNPLEDDQSQVTVIPEKIADLSLLKKVDISTPRVGDNVKFTLELSNAGPSDATAVVVNDLLPSGYSVVSYTTTSGNYDADSGDWTLSGNVLKDKNEFLEIVAKVNPITGAANEYKNNAQVAVSGTNDPDSTPNDGIGDDFATVSTVPTALIDLSLTKSVDNVAPVVGSNVVFTVTVKNAGPSTATGIEVTDVLPSGYKFVSATPSATYDGGIWAIPSIAKGSSATLTVTAEVNAQGIYTNVAEVTKANETDIDSTPSNNVLAEDDQDEVTTSREPLIDLSLNKVILGGATPNVGDNVTFRITVKNAGPSDATGVVVTDRLPSGYAFVNVAPSQATYDSTTGSWSVGNLVNGGSASIDLVATVLATGNYNNIAEVTGATVIDSNSTPGNNDATENDQMEVIVTPIQVADLSVVKSVNISTPVVGTNVVFTIEIKNAGPSAATGVVIEDKLPSGYEFISATPTAGMYNRTTGLWTVTRPIVSLSSESIDITAKVLATGDYSNTAIVIASDITDPDLGNNSSTVNNIAPSAIVDLVVAKRISNPTPDVGSTVVFTVDVTNNGPSTATEVEVKDQLQSGYTYLSDSSAGSYNAGTGLWTIGTLTNGATRTLTITATVNAAGDYGNSAVASSLEAESTSGNNSISISSTPRPVANLSLTKVVANQSINVGQNAVFNLVITNAGPSAATGVIVTDKLPSGYKFENANASNGTTYDSASGAWVVGTVANGATATLSITAKVLAAGEYTNVAQVTGSDHFDPNSIPGNNNPIEDDQAQAFVTPINEANLVTVKTVSAVNVAGISASNPNEGDTIKYSLVVSNNGGPTNATAVTLTDLLPTGVTFVTYSATSGVYNYGSGIWTIGNINVNSNATLDITVKVNEGTKGTTITNQTTAATGDQTDPSTVGDDLIEMITVSKPPVATNDSNVGNIPNNASAPISILSNDTLQDGSAASTTTTTVDLDPSTPGIDNSILIPGEGTWNYDSAGGTIIFTPLNGFTTDPKPLQYQLTEAATGLSDTAIVTVDYITQAPTANNDTKGAAPKGPVTLDPLNGVGADTDIDGTIIASTVSLVIPSGATGIVTESSGDVTSFMVPNEGTWSLNPITAEITFTPLASFVKDPTPIEYTVKDNDGNISNKATVTIDYVPAAVNDKNDVIGIPTAPVTLNVVTNDNNGDTVNPASVVLLATSIASGVQVTPNQVDVPGVGSWIADVNGNVTFTPAIGYTQDPPIISYTVEDDEGNVSMPATITLDYAPISSTDLSTGNPINTPIVIDVVANDSNGDVIDPTTVSLVNPGNATNIVTDANGDITSLLIPGEGTWNVDLVTGAVTFTPNPGFIINPTPINYNVEDNEGNPSNNSLITIEMVPQADLVITKTDNKEKYTPGTNSVYTITVKNNGPAVATNVVVLDDISYPILEAVTTWSAVGTGSAVPPNATGTGDLTAANATIATVAVGETVTYTVTIAVPSNFTGQIANTASVSSDVEDPDTTNNSQTDVDTMAALSEIAVVKTVASTTPYEVGGDIEFLITATNNGPSDATGINIVDKLPSGYNLVSVTPSIGTYTPANGLWNVGGLTNRSSATLTVVATINETGNYTNSAEVTKVDQLDPNGIVHGNNTPSEIDQSDVTIVPVKIVDLVTTKTVDKSNPNQGDLVKYTLTVVNKGPSLATGVSLTDNLPAGLVYVSHVATGGTVNTYSGGLWTIGNINIGSSVTLVIDARVTAAGTPAQTPIVNTATAAIGNELDPTTAGDDLTEPIVVTSADLVTEKTVSNATPGEGETITYSIKVTNNGPSVATGVRLTDILPIGVTYASNNQVPDYNYGSGLWTVGDLAVGASKVLNVNVTINSGAAGKTIVNTTTAAKGDQSDPTDVGNDLNETIIVQNNADVVLTKTVDNNSPNIGDVVTYTVTVANKGTTLVTNLVVKDDLPAGLTYVSATPAKGTWTGPNWTVGTLLPGEKGSIVIKALVGMDQGGKVLTNTVSNTQDQFDTNTTPDDPSETVTVTSLDLAVAKTVSNATPNIGDVITYTIQIKNNGASNATNVSLTDNLPVGVTYVSNTVSQGVFNTGSGLWTVGDMANGSVATLTLNARVNEGTYGKTITNTTTPVKADQSDSNVSNNIGTVAIVPTAFIDLRLTKEVVANVTAPAVGEIIAFEIRVINDGPTKATGVQVVDLIPSGYKFKNYSSTIGTYSPLTGLWNIGFIEVGNTAVLIVDVEVLNSGDYLNCAEITRANEPDVDSTPGNGNVSEDDYACASVSPNQAVDLAVVKTILKNNSNPQVDSEISFEILLTNNGNIDATDVVVSDLLPPGYTFVNYSSTKGIYDYVTGNWKVSKILNGETEILIVDVLVNESGSYLNCATITALHQTDTNPDNNVSCIAAAPIAVIDLELSKTVDNLQPITETNVEFTITLTNSGPSNATGVVVKDLLPSGFTFVNATTTTGTYDQVTGVWNVGDIAIDQTQVLKVVAFVLPVGEFTNVAEVIAANELDIDSTPGNNKILEDDQDAVTIEPEISIVLSEGFTPNGDGINDVFEIQHLQVLYPNFSMEIVNRYGNIVYQYKHNGDKFTTPKWWDGYSDGRWNLTNDTLPAGTYFYTIYFNNDDRAPQTGWIYLRK